MRKDRLQWAMSVWLELIGSVGLMLVVAARAPWDAPVWAPCGYLVYLAFAYRRWMRL